MFIDIEVMKKLYEFGDKLLVYVGFIINVSSSLIFLIYNVVIKIFFYFYVNDYFFGEEI